nr:retrovirus-related Pol polyprotein from transposon TNT 1-94 [Tanacetum cinerariifolium]
MVAVDVAIGEAICDGIVNDIMGDETGKGTIEGNGEMGSEPDVHSSKDQFRAPTAHDMEILIQTCLMPLAIKTQSDSLKFVHGLKQEMHADLKYVESLEKEIDELASDKAEFSDMYDVILQECVKECDCLAQNLSKQTKLLVGNHGFDLYTISLQKSTSSTLLCLMAKATPTQAWLWHRRLSHLNFDYINLLSKKDIVIGLPKLKYVKDQICSSCELRKAKRSSFKLKSVSSSKGRLNLLHIDLCGPMRVASINEKKYILVIVDDYSRYTWTLFLCSKDETPEVLKYFLTMIQRNLQASVITVHTNRGTEFLNKTLNAFFKEEGIEHQTSTARTPKQNSVVERRNRTLVEAARTMLSALQLLIFFWADAIATACYTQNRSIIIPTHGKHHITSSMTGNPLSNTFTFFVSDYDNPDPVPQRQVVYSSADADVPSQQELDLLIGPLYDEFFNAEQVRGNPSRPVQTRRQLATYPEMCMYTLTMSTRSYARNLFPPLDNPELPIRRRSHIDPTLLNDFEMATEGNDDPPVLDLQTMKELCQSSLNGRDGTFMKRHPEECYDLIENMTAHHNDWDTSAQRTTVGQNQNVYASGAYQGGNSYQPQGSGTLPSNIVTNPKEYLKGITTQSGTAYQGPTIPTTSSCLPIVVEHETDVTKDMVPPTNNRSTKDVQPLVVQVETPTTNNESTKYVQPLVVQVKTPILNFEPIVAPIAEPVIAPVSAPKPNQKPSIPYMSRLHDQKLRDKNNDQKEKFFKIFQDLNFNISFVDTLILMPKFGPFIKSLLTNKDKLFDLARNPLNEHCSVVLLKKLPKNWGTLTMWNKLFLPQLTPTLMTLELADRSISRPIGVAKDVFVKVGKFYFPADFVVVDFDADPRVPLILKRSFLKTGRALIDVYAGVLNLRVNNEAVTFNLDQTSRYSANYNDMTANQIDVIDMACEEYSQEVLGFFDVIASGNPTPYYDPIVSTSSPTLTPFEDSDFLLEEVNAFLAFKDNPTSLEVYHSYFDTERDILLLEAFLNDDPSLPSPNQGMHLAQV